MPKKKKLLIVCGSGGHSAQARKLYPDLKEAFDCSFLLESNDPLTAQKITDAKIYKAVPVRGKKEPKIFVFFRLVWCVIQTFFVFLRLRPQVIVSTGPGFAGPICIWGKIFGRKVIFIESWSRVTSRSWPGKLLYKIVDRFYVQWPEQTEKNYPEAVFVGRLG